MRSQNVNSDSRQLHSIDAVRGAFAQFGVTPAEPGEIDEAQAFAARLIGGKIATPATIARVHARTGVGLFVVREAGELTAVVALVFLSEAGRRAVWTDAFDSVNPAASHIMRRGGEPAGIYGWGIAATNHQAAQRAIEGYELTSRIAVPHLAVFGRPVTPAGLRLMIDRLGFKPVPGSTSGLVWIEPSAERQQAAAA